MNPLYVSSSPDPNPDDAVQRTPSQCGCHYSYPPPPALLFWAFPSFAWWSAADWESFPTLCISTVGKRVAKAMLEVRSPHPVLLSTVHKTSVAERP